jgi:tetratricopeptide (TPR) repeat protein
MMPAAGLVLAVLALLSFERAKVWRNSQTLWEDAVAKQPGSGTAWYMLGTLYENQGKNGAAIAVEEQAKTVCRGGECRLVLRELSSLYLRENRYEEAKNTIAELLARYPQDAVGQALHGHLQYQQGNLRGAEDSYRLALRLDPKMTAAMTALGNVYLATDRPSLALDAFSSAGRLQQPTAELSYSMACAAALLGKRSLALEMLDESLRLGYNKPDLLLHNPELASLQDDQDFRRLVERYFPKR